MYVANTRGDGVVLRASAPAGQRIGGLAEGARVTLLGDEQTIEGRRWVRVQDGQGRDGWLAATYLSAVPPAGVSRPGQSPTSTATRAA